MLVTLLCIPIVISIFFLKWKFVLMLAAALIILTFFMLWCLSKCFGLDLMSGTDHVFHEMKGSTISFFVVAEKKITDFEQFK